MACGPRKWHGCAGIAHIRPGIENLKDALGSRERLLQIVGNAGHGIDLAGELLEHTRENDLEVNPTKSKQLTNFRTTMKDDKQFLPPPRQITLEDAIAYIQDDELVEVTPKAIRLRKRHLDANMRKRMSKAAAAE